MFSNIQYYFWASYRRKIIDKLSEKNKSLYTGVVLDIGGRDRGKFKKPKKKVENWIFADIEEKHNPDMVLDVMDMHAIANNSIDIISALELFEHVSVPEKGIAECSRVLKNGGLLIISMPFMYGTHADPYDFQRWTKAKWELVLNENNLNVLKIEEMGFFFTVLMDAIKNFLKKSHRIFRYISYCFYPIFDIIASLDNINSKNPILKSYVGGYFIIAKK
ncbi:MAG: methyltransferase domain-containing protein [Candidatus Moranbacteria bacterium]|jgi:SAM-dependent methyltransferase|nr:methyltransferase domain-containing protein [Candidatus Moranbacteria bacterium]